MENNTKIANHFIAICKRRCNPNYLIWLFNITQKTREGYRLQFCHIKFTCSLKWHSVELLVIWCHTNLENPVIPSHNCFRSDSCSLRFVCNMHSVNMQCHWILLREESPTQQRLEWNQRKSEIMTVFMLLAQTSCAIIHTILPKQL